MSDGRWRRLGNEVLFGMVCLDPRLMAVFQQSLRDAAAAQRPVVRDADEAIHDVRPAAAAVVA